MEDKHRKLIEENIDKLMDYTDYSKLIHACVKHDILSIRMYQNIEHDKLLNDISKDITREKHKRLFIKLTKRGPDAYQKLINILNSLGYYDAADILLDVKFTSINDTMRKINTWSPVKHKLEENHFTTSSFANSENRTFDVTKSTTLQKSEKYYPMIKKNRGILFMVNIIEFMNESTRKRNGAEKDTYALKRTFDGLNFKIYSYDNMNKSDFIIELNKVLSSEETKQVECFVLIVMSHGNLDRNDSQYLAFKDEKMKTNDILKFFSEQNCPNLNKKPKIIIFPFCRNTYPDQNPSELEPDEAQLSLTDTLVCYACTMYKSAHREPDYGSWFIQELCSNLCKYAHNTYFENIFKEVQVAVEKKYSTTLVDKETQIPNYHNRGFSKTLYFNPGLYEDDLGNICSFEESHSES